MPEAHVPPEALEAASATYRLEKAAVRIDGVRFNPIRYPFLVELYDEPHEDVRIRKGTQLGLTSWAVLTVIDRMQHLYARGVLYSFPTEDEVYDFAQSRFERLLTDNPHLFTGVVEGTDRTNLKRIGEGYLYFRGMRASRQSPIGRSSKLLSIPVDLVVFDEFDEMDPVAIRTAEERLSGSEHRHSIRLGHPSLPGYGIDEAYESSDQRHWMIRCDGCRHHTCLDLEFPECIKEIEDDHAIAVCGKCGKELNRNQGEWVPASPDVKARGYWISQLLSPTVPLHEILQDYEKSTRTGHGVQEMHNFRLGLPWADIDEAIDAETVKGLCNSDQPPTKAHQGPSFGGADVGKKHIHVAIGYRPTEGGALQFTRFPLLKTFDELHDVCRAHNMDCLVIDQMAETRSVRQFCKRVSYAWGCQYSHGQRHSYIWDGKERTVRVNRTESIDGSHLAMIENKLRWHRYNDRFGRLVVPQLCNLVRVVIQDRKTGQETPRWVVRGVKNDHWRHALNYSIIASERVGVARRTQRSRDYMSSRHRPASSSGGWMAT